MASLSLQAYLKKKYSSGDDEAEKKKNNKTRRKKKSSKLKDKNDKGGITKNAVAAAGGGVVIVDDDAAWYKNVVEEEDSEAEVEEAADAPQVIEDVEVKRMHKMEMLKQHRPYMSVANDGSGWVSQSEQDLSPPRRNVQNQDLSPLRRSSVWSPDLSPPRRRKAQDQDLSPPRRSNVRSPDFSPPRRKKAQDLSPPPARNMSGQDLSPPRRKAQSHEDLSPLRRHVHSGDFANPKKRARSPDLSPPRRTQSHDLSPPRSKAQNQDSSSPPQRKLRAGLTSDKELAQELARKKQDDAKRMKDMDPSLSGRGAETIYRDKRGKRLEGLEELLRQQQGDLKPPEKPLEWGKGLAQKREAELKQAEFEEEKNKPFARTRDDPELDKAFRERLRWGDPMAHLVKKKSDESMLVDLGASEEMKESGFIVPQEIPKHSWLKRGVAPPANRYDIKPGRHWDGVDRSTGFEKEMFKSRNEKQALEREAYLWSVSDM
ncbi:unnamed protein product [Sphagnum compactum]